jgi:hypothetical protein
MTLLWAIRVFEKNLSSQYALGPELDTTTSKATTTHPDGELGDLLRARVVKGMGRGSGRVFYRSGNLG